MLKEDLVTIVVPIYNASKHLKTCIRSILDQTYRNLEILCIDDGSTDNSSQIITEFASNDSRVKLQKQRNKGVSAARNLALDLASGKFVGFVDSDDWIDPTMIHTMVEIILKTNSDLVICGVRQHRDCASNQSNLRRQFETAHFAETEDMHCFMSRFVRCQFDYSNWNKLYRNDLIEDNGLRFQEGIHMGEDCIFNLQYLQHCRTVYTIDLPLYQYRLNPNSLWHVDGLKRWQGHCKKTRRLEALLSQQSLQIRKEDINYLIHETTIFVALPALVQYLRDKKALMTNFGRQEIEIAPPHWFRLPGKTANMKLRIILLLLRKRQFGLLGLYWSLKK